MILSSSDLFTLDIANNHFGDLNHAKEILNSFIPIIKDTDLRVSIKFQLRNLSTFIHPDYRKNSKYKKIDRFLSTKLSTNDFIELIAILKKNNILTMATPFDEESVEFILEQDIDIIKVASASSQEWPLLNKIVSAKKPVIISTGGLSLEDIDRIYQFFSSAGIEFAMMHCVSIYPTENADLQLNQISILKDRYRDIPIGFSTHEKPYEYDPIKIAVAKGSTIFERHIGIESAKYMLNSYSSTPEHTKKWFEAYKNAKEIIGSSKRPPSKIDEINDLNALKRGVYASKDILKGEIIDYNNVFFAMPLLDEGVSLKNWIPGKVAEADIRSNEPLNSGYYVPKNSEEDIIFKSIRQAKSILLSNNIVFPNDSNIELSHHYGVMRFREYGAIIIDVVNLEYCKKLILMLPRQKHPYHLHKEKKETFIILYGELLLEIDGYEHKLFKGDIITINPGMWHKFQSLKGCIFEEISTTSLQDDSYYEDDKIALINKAMRKTNVTNIW